MKRLCFILLFALLSMTVSVAQDGSEWELVIVEPFGGTGAIYTLTPNGIQSVANVSLIGEFSTRLTMISSDRQYVMFLTDANKDDDIASNQVFVANLATDTCCILLADPQYPELNQSYPSGFNPEGNLAAAVIYSTEDEQARVTVFDAATGEVMYSIDAGQLVNTGGDQTAGFPIVGTWGERGLQLTANCWFCTLPEEHSWQYWTPESDELTEQTETFRPGWIRLPGTGEAIRFTLNRDFPSVPPTSAPSYGQQTPAPPANVIEYLPAGASYDEREVIYFNADHLQISEAYWVYDGRGVVVVHERTEVTDFGAVEVADGAFLLLRDGTQIPVPMEGVDLYSMLGGTPDGWMAFGFTTNTERSFLHYTVDDSGSISFRNIGKVNDWPTLIDSPVLGTGISQPSFVTVRP